MGEALQKAEAFYFKKFLPSIASYLTIRPSSFNIVMSKNSHNHITQMPIAQKSIQGTNSKSNMKSCFTKVNIKPDTICNPHTTLDGSSVAETK